MYKSQLPDHVQATMYVKEFSRVDKEVVIITMFAYFVKQSEGYIYLFWHTMPNSDKLHHPYQKNHSIILSSSLTHSYQTQLSHIFIL